VAIGDPADVTDLVDLMVSDLDGEPGRPAVPAVVPLEIGAEPEQMVLWRKIIARRENLVERAQSWHAFLVDQRAKFEQRDLEHARMGVSEAERADNRRITDEAEERLRGGVLRLCRLVERMDDEIKHGSAETSKEGRGLNLKTLRELADPSGEANLEREEAVGYVLRYLEAKKGNVPEDRQAAMARRSARAVLARHFGARLPVDADGMMDEAAFAALEGEARTQRKIRETTGGLRALAESIVDAARSMNAAGK
jgi:hypothetical protein